jgi:2-octaprenyl-6-methoxyphenol hydroxylase
MLAKLQELSDGSRVDVIIVGAGMVGASTAIGLNQIGLKVILIDAFGFSNSVPAYTPSYDARSTALSWGTRDILTALGVWREVEKQACPITEVHVSEKDRFGTTRIKAEDYSQSAVGYVVPNQWLGRCLLSRVDDLGIPIYASVKVEEIHQGAFQKLVLTSIDESQLASKRSIETRLLIIADGTDSNTAKKLGIESDIQQYAQHAIITNVTTELENNGTAYERFTNKGPLAMLPLSDYECAVVWTHDQSEVSNYLEMDDNEFCLAIEASFGERLGRIERCGERVSYPLKLIQAKEQYRSGVLLLGNAAHSLHPVAGQGFNLAIRGVAACVENIAQCQEQGLTFESLDNLSKLCACRVDDQNKTIALSDQLVKVFGSSSKILSIAREFGLIGLDNAPILKAFFASQAMGLAGRKSNLHSNT